MENKDADQLRSYCEADRRFCFRIFILLVSLLGGSNSILVGTLTIFHNFSSTIYYLVGQYRYIASSKNKRKVKCEYDVINNKKTSVQNRYQVIINDRTKSEKNDVLYKRTMSDQYRYDVVNNKTTSGKSQYDVIIFVYHYDVILTSYTFRKV